MGGCFDLIPCPDRDSCFLKDNLEAVCAESINDCDGVRQAYDNEIALSPITTARSGSSALIPGVYAPPCIPNDCEIVPGHCAAGLDTCWFVGKPSAELERLASLYTRLGCASSVECVCPEPPFAIACEVAPDGGTWNVEGEHYTSACVVH